MRAIVKNKFVVLDKKFRYRRNMALKLEILQSALQSYKEQGGDIKSLATKAGINASTLYRALNIEFETKLETWEKLHKAEPSIIPPPVIVDGAGRPVQSNAEIIPATTGGMVPIPVFSCGAGAPHGLPDGGFPVDASDRVIYVNQAEVDENTFGIRVVGDSMETTLYEGDEVLVVPSKKLNNGNICFATWPGKDGPQMVKRFRRQGDITILESDNKDHEPIIVTPKDGDVRLYRVTRLLNRIL
jgi:SOS-response transcriptional repressor LexA